MRVIILGAILAATLLAACGGTIPAGGAGAPRSDPIATPAAAPTGTPAPRDPDDEDYGY